MARFLLYAISGVGQKFTPWGLRESQDSLPPQSLGGFGDATREGDLVTRRALSAAGDQSRTIGYSVDPAASDARSASEWWDQRINAGADGSIASIRRNVLTGSLVVGDLFLQPSGLVAGWARFSALSEERSLLPSVVAREGQWQAADLLSLSPEGLHAALVSRDDIIEGSSAGDQIAGGAGLNSLFGREGADEFYFQPGEKSKWYTKKQKGKGLQISPAQGAVRGGKQRYAYDPDVSIVNDFERGIDRLYLPGRPSSYYYSEVNGNSLVFSGKNQRDLLAVIVGAKGLDGSDFLQY